LFGQNDTGNLFEFNLYNITSETNFVINLKNCTSFAKESFNFNDFGYQGFNINDDVYMVYGGANGLHLTVNKKQLFHKLEEDI